ncbi:UNVERIFIED_CONTAM: hypothetical protein GTU68_050838 [Idotea baltica]|nr:hypothetical protein [Idotea baltica]
MADYKAPLQEVSFVINDLLNFSQLNKIPEFSDATPDLVDAVITEAGKFAADVFAPINRIGDIEHSKASNGEVITPKGFKEAYQFFVDNGWMSLAQDPNFGGQGLPFTVHMTTSEFWNSANTAMALCPMLTAGAIDVLSAHGSDELKRVYLEKLISGAWTGTMNLTESHAGSDLSNLKTKATPNGDHYLIKGQKIFITWGEHDMAENIIHLVLAPMVDAAAGVKGLSLFVVPKYLVNQDGSLGERNDLKVVSTEHKLGINASPTCVMSFGEDQGAIGYLIGEPGQGLTCMFTLMNHARLEEGTTGIQANDLIGRKLVRDNGAGFQALMSEVDETLAVSSEQHSKLVSGVVKAKADLEEAVAYILKNVTTSPKFEGAVATNFLMQIGYVIGAWYHLRSALIAQQKLDSGAGDSQFYQNKILGAKFYISQILPRASAHGTAIIDGADVGCELSKKAF